MSELLASEESPDICERCSTSSHCSQLRLALAILGQSLEDAPLHHITIRYHEILRELKKAGWDYPQSRRSCKLENDAEKIKNLTDELIALAKERNRQDRNLSLAASQNKSPSSQDPFKGLSLYEEETSCE